MTTPKRYKGVLIAFEGIDGSGKTTQAKKLAAAFREWGVDFIQSKEPTGGPWGQKIRESKTKGRMLPALELQAFLNDRKEHVADVIDPALALGKVVIVDRYFYSTVAYQGARGLDPDHLFAANAFAPKPDLVALLDVPPRIGLGRIAGRGDTADLFEKEVDLEKARAIFNSLKGPNILKLDGQRPELEIHGEIVEWLMAGPLDDRKHLYRRAIYSYIDESDRAFHAQDAEANDRPASYLASEAERIASDDSVPVEEKALALARSARAR